MEDPRLLPLSVNVTSIQGTFKIFMCLTCDGLLAFTSWRSTLVRSPHTPAVSFYANWNVKIQCWLIFLSWSVFVSRKKVYTFIHLSFFVVVGMFEIPWKHFFIVSGIWTDAKQFYCAGTFYCFRTIDLLCRFVCYSQGNFCTDRHTDRQCWLVSKQWHYSVVPMSCISSERHGWHLSRFVCYSQGGNFYMLYTFYVYCLCSMPTCWLFK